MKKVCYAVLFLMLAAGISRAAVEKKILRLGLLSKLNSTEEEFSEIWRKNFAPNDEALDITVKFYDTLTSMQMALNAGEIREMVLPDFAAEYLMNQNDDYESFLVLRSKGSGLAFGFREDGGELRDKFNEALKTLRDNWTLAALEGKYIASPGMNAPEPVKFFHFDGAPAIKAAVTGDLPPIDFIASDGSPAGFNTAVLAEIANILHMNVELLNVDAGARTASLASGRADVVFWYEVDMSGKGIQPDVPQGVILSEPYYEWQKFIHLRKTDKRKGSWDWWDFKNNIFNLYWR